MNNKTILITGAEGMLGSEAVALFREFNYNVIAVTRSDFDITNLAQVRKFFSGKKVDYILHAAAYTKVDDAESNKDLAFLVNAKGAENMAIVANECAAIIIFISSDYVFDGTKNSSYLTTDKANPVSVYGASKFSGEEMVRAKNSRHYIARTSWLYGKNGKNFVDTMVNLSKTNKEIRVVNDQFGCPTLTTDLIFAIRDLLKNKSDFGTYHLCGFGITSWYEFAKKIFEIMQIKINVIPVSTAEYKRAATRPQFSAMFNDNLLRPWEEALGEFLIKKYQ